MALSVVSILRMTATRMTLGLLPAAARRFRTALKAGLQPRDEGVPARPVVRDREPLALRQHGDIETVLRHVDSTIGMLYHPRVPSLLMRARALATVREWKKRLEHQAHSRPVNQGGHGLPVVTGAVS